MGKQKKPVPQTGAFRRDRGTKSGTTGKSKSGWIVGLLTGRNWGKKGGWDSPGR